jgi:hypothetical protein
VVCWGKDIFSSFLISLMAWLYETLLGFPYAVYRC